MRATSRFAFVLPVLIVRAFSSPPAVAATQGTAFVYQGRLTSSGAPVNGTCTFVFTLWDALSGGSQIPGTLSPSVQVTNGLFTTELDFGHVFGGDKRWLDITVNCGGGVTPLGPRQPLDGVPYAQGLEPGASISGDASVLTRDLLTLDDTATTGYSNGLHSNSHTPNGSGIWGTNSGSGYGVSGESTTGHAILGTAHGTNTAGVWGNHTSNGYGVYGSSYSGYGVYGLGYPTGNKAGVLGTGSSAGVEGFPLGGAGVSYGVYGHTAITSESYGVYGTSAALGGAGVYGVNTGGGPGVKGEGGTGGLGVSGTGVIGVYGKAGGASGGYGIYGDDANISGAYAGLFLGKVLASSLLVGSSSFTQIKGLQAGIATVGSNGTCCTHVTVNFPVAFNDYPHVVATVRNDSGYPDVDDTFVVSVRSIGKSSVVFNIVRVDTSAGWSQSLQLDWLAWLQ